MRDRRRIAGFERAVLMALLLPAAAACGGRSGMLLPLSDGGEPGVPAPLPEAGTGTDGAACAWQTAPPSPYCTWNFSFTGEGCAGFEGEGTASECLAVCGRDSEGDAPDYCYVSTVGGGQEYFLNCSVTTSSACQQQFTGNGGRRPEYFASLGFGPAPSGREVGTHFARVACLEAGSVDAFRQLRDELRAHRAPARLVRAASRAMRDEMRHVRQTSALARRFGERPVAPRPVPALAPRDLESLALENAVEGCVRETYSALECRWQAEVAADPVVRATMTRIARDEMRHLALSWAVHVWAMSKLDAEGRARVRGRQRQEIAGLMRELRVDPAERLVGSGGLPRAWQSRVLVGAIEARLAS